MSESTPENELSASDSNSELSELLSCVRILGIDYPIVHSDMCGTNGNTDYGNVNHGKCQINIDRTSNSPDHARSVLIHEIIETLNFRFELDLRHSQITQLEAGLIQVIRDNPDLLPCLAG